MAKVGAKARADRLDLAYYIFHIPVFVVGTRGQWE